jgi:hypothetical protein
MHFLKCALIFLAASVLCPAQMTPDQKMFDMFQLSTTYAMNYGPLQWKRDAFKYDLLDISTWLDKAAKSKDDLDYYEVLVAYVAALNDAHDVFQLPSDFQATLGFSVDIYDGKILVDFAPGSNPNGVAFPVVGDELVSIDGTAAADLIQAFTKYAIAANPLSTSRVAASLLTNRVQYIMPHAHEIPDVSTVVLRHADGSTDALSLAWNKTGTPLTLIGPVISPHSSITPPVGDPAPERASVALQRRLGNMRIPGPKLVLGFGAAPPVFALPSSFVIRLGSSRFASLYSGVFQAQGLNIGYIRIPSFFVSGSTFQAEIDYMQQNTDGLIIDIMRNPGGSGCNAENLLSRIIPSQFRTIGLEIRATRSWVTAYAAAYQDSIDFGDPDDVVQQWKQLLQQVTDAWHTPSGRTGPLPVCSSSLNVNPATDTAGKMVAYTKPVMLLTDEFSASAADFFAAVFQDNQRGIIFGNRTMGAGGNVNDYLVTTYSEGLASVTESLMSRKNPVTVDGFPTAPYVENIGVRPDVFQAYMTRDNLTNKGATFVQAFSDTMVSYINSQKK